MKWGNLTKKAKKGQGIRGKG